MSKLYHLNRTSHHFYLYMKFIFELAETHFFFLTNKTHCRCPLKSRKLLKHYHKCINKMQIIKWINWTLINQDNEKDAKGSLYLCCWLYIPKHFEHYHHLRVLISVPPFLICYSQWRYCLDRNNLFDIHKCRPW